METSARNTLTNRALHTNAVGIGSRILTVIGVWVLTGCASAPVLAPVSSTYPANRVTTVVSRTAVPIPVDVKVKASVERETGDGESIEYSPGRVNLGTETRKEVVGDDALTTVWILPEGRRQANEEFLMDKINEVGQTACSNQFKVSDSRYFYGTEATLTYSGLSGPALRVTYRCAAERQPTTDTGIVHALHRATQFPDHEFFDASLFVVACSSTAVSKALDGYLANQSASIEREESGDGISTIIAQYSRRTLTYEAPEQLVVVLRELGEQTRMALVLLRHRRAQHRRGVTAAGTAKPGFDWGTMPVARNAAFVAGQELAARLESDACD